MDYLDPEQKDKLHIFVDITGITDLSIGASRLESTDWNLELAVSRFFDGTGEEDHPQTDPEPEPEPEPKYEPKHEYSDEENSDTPRFTSGFTSGLGFETDSSSRSRDLYPEPAKFRSNTVIPQAQVRSQMQSQAKQLQRIASPHSLLYNTEAIPLTPGRGSTPVSSPLLESPILQTDRRRASSQLNNDVHLSSENRSTSQSTAAASLAFSAARSKTPIGLASTPNASHISRSNSLGIGTSSLPRPRDPPLAHEIIPKIQAASIPKPKNNLLQQWNELVAGSYMGNAEKPGLTILLLLLQILIVIPVTLLIKLTLNVYFLGKNLTNYTRKTIDINEISPPVSESESRMDSASPRSEVSTSNPHEQNSTNIISPIGRLRQSYDSSIPPTPPLSEYEPEIIQAPEPVVIKEKKLPFFEGPYNSALNEAKSSYRWLLVILQNASTLTVNPFESVLSDSNFREFVKQNEIIIWSGDIVETEAKQVADGFCAAKFPFLILIANVSPQMETAPKMSVILRLQGITTAETYIDRLKIKIELYDPQLITKRMEWKERKESRRIQEEQDLAYQRSLKADREKLALKLAEEKEEREKIMILEAEGRARQQLERLRLQWLRWKTMELEKKDKIEIFRRGRFCRISFRLATGERIVKNFTEDATFYDIYCFIECQMAKKELSENKTPGRINEPKGYLHHFKFELTNPHPREVIEPDKRRKVKDVEWLWPNGTLWVEEEWSDSEDESYSEERSSVVETIFRDEVD